MDNQAATPPPPAPRLLEEVRNVMRLHHHSIHTERTYVEWIERYVRFHHRTCREDLAGGEGKIKAFVTDLAIRGKMAPATPNQDLAIAMIGTHIFQQGGHGVASLRDDLQGSVWRPLRERSNRRHAFPSCYVMRIHGHVPMVGRMERPRKLFPQRFFAG